MCINDSWKYIFMYFWYFVKTQKSTQCKMFQVLILWILAILKICFKLLPVIHLRNSTTNQTSWLLKRQETQPVPNTDPLLEPIEKSTWKMFWFYCRKWWMVLASFKTISCFHVTQMPSLCYFFQLSVLEDHTSPFKGWEEGERQRCIISCVAFFKPLSLGKEL